MQPTMQVQESTTPKMVDDAIKKILSVRPNVPKRKGMSACQVLQSLLQDLGHAVSIDDIKSSLQRLEHNDLVKIDWIGTDDRLRIRSISALRQLRESGKSVQAAFTNMQDRFERTRPGAEQIDDADDADPYKGWQGLLYGNAVRPHLTHSRHTQRPSLTAG